MDKELKMLAVQLSFKNMIKKGWFDITAVKESAELLGVQISSEQNSFMRLLHCIHFGDMDPPIKEALQLIMTDVFSSEAFEIVIGKTWLGNIKKEILKLS